MRPQSEARRRVLMSWYWFPTGADDPRGIARTFPAQGEAETFR